MGPRAKGPLTETSCQADPIPNIQIWIEVSVPVIWQLQYAFQFWIYFWDKLSIEHNTWDSLKYEFTKLRILTEYCVSLIRLLGP